MEFEILKEAIAKILQVYETEIREESTFEGELGADSLDMAQIARYVEERMDIKLDESEFDSIITVRDAVKMMEKARK